MEKLKYYDKYLEFVFKFNIWVNVLSYLSPLQIAALNYLGHSALCAE